ncbi:MAG: DUF1028 domain-containing protein [Betaproteobacteria bacterium]|nr:DUF1028 domain-containing protein [Betaproteobacteria bacterium]
MTFTVLGYCPRSGKAGFCQATSTPAVGWRCTDVVPGRGVLTVQAHGDYRQLQLAKKLMAFGYSPAKVLKDLAADDKFFDYRQIAVLDFYGNAAVNTGSRARPWAGELAGPDFVATGNVLVGEKVVKAMADAFRGASKEELEERLLRTVEAGRDAGGQEEGQTSSALVVYEKHEFPIVNLRVDVSLEPVGELRKIFDWFKPLIPYYVERTLDPGSVVPKKAWLEKRGLVVNPYSK